MYGLEHSAFIINVTLAFICTDLMLLHFLNVGKDFEKKTGIIGSISGIIGFIITLVYACFSGYIFNNDVAYGILDESSLSLIVPNNLPKLFSNGALYKKDETTYFKVNENDKSENSEYLLYKNLGEKQYNYNSEFYKTYYENEPTSDSIAGCNILINYNIQTGTAPSSQCEYLYLTPQIKVENKLF